MKLTPRDQQDDEPADSPIFEGTLRDMEKQAILNNLEKFNGNKDLTAQHLGISRATLWRKLKEM
ncbi:helix-turn-helix domain-containing protein [Peribacillus kribbensis]|uniref:helix-turn-helix domain-containing protein n=1 Tax=Peribacillus kribbensis TaxID=356658 RepID=UPI0003F973D5|nr:helix-turn-helix domain-containing protein [Peribacillus kribbensis]